MYLQPEQMSDAMREEHAGNTRFQSSLAGQLGQTHALHDIAQNAVRGEMHVAVIAAGDDLIAQSLLRLVHGLHQVGKAAGCGGIGARDIGRIAAVLGAGIDQE